MIEDRVALKQRVKEASDIVDIIGSYISLRPAGAIFLGVCPFHDDHRPSFQVDPRKQRFHCWPCDKKGDVINFVQEFEHVSFLEALELLAKRAGISLESLKNAPHEPSRALMLEVVRWAAGEFQTCLLDGSLAEEAREYLGERHLAGETVRRFGLGYAPAQGEWLVQKAIGEGINLEMLVKVGLIAERKEGNGYYDRFRDRVIFPIRDARGQTVGFGGRILPSSPLLTREAPPPKYYNSAETALFSKSNQLYGIDQARQSAINAGYLAVVEGYTDVLMAHQFGITNVVATMGTALNDKHVRKLRGTVSNVVLVFDADAGGMTGVDRALEVFVRQEMDLRVATLPEGLDPCDLLVKEGAAPFQAALESAVDVFEYKLNQLWKQEAGQGLEGQRRAVDKMLTILAVAPEERGVRMELMVNRIAHRLQLKEETIWARYRELRLARPRNDRDPRPVIAPVQEQSTPAPRCEIDLVEMLLASPDKVAPCRLRVPSSEFEHPGLRRLVEGLYALSASGLRADLDHLRERLDNERLLDKAEELLERGLNKPDTQANFDNIIERFHQRREQRRLRDLKNQLDAATDQATIVALLRQLKSQTNDQGSESPE